MARPKQTRSRLFKLRLSPPEVEVLDLVATEHGLDPPSLLRMLIAHERRRLFGSAEAVNAKPRS